MIEQLFARLAESGRYPTHECLVRQGVHAIDDVGPMGRRSSCCSVYGFQVLEKMDVWVGWKTIGARAVVAKCVGVVRVDGLLRKVLCDNATVRVISDGLKLGVSTT
jgi:hypothetical protein